MVLSNSLQFEGVLQELLGQVRYNLWAEELAIKSGIGDKETTEYWKKEEIRLCNLLPHKQP